LGDRNIADMAATALAFSGTPCSDLDGNVIEEIAGTTADKTVDATSTPDGDDSKELPLESRGLTQEEQESISSHLRSLGYIE